MLTFGAKGQDKGQSLISRSSKLIKSIFSTKSIVFLATFHLDIVENSTN